MGIKQQIPTQADKRRNLIFYDQHRPPKHWYQAEQIRTTYGLTALRGRPWFASIEKESGYPTGLVQALFEVPHVDLLPPQKFMAFPEQEPGRLVILYAEWDAEREAAFRAWEQERLRHGRQIHGLTFDPKAEPSMQLLDIIGPRPMSPLPVRAMRQENSWALGFTTKRPPQADDFFPRATETPLAAVFTETEPVFTETEEEGEDAPVGGGTTLAALLAEVEAQCPPNIHGGAKKAWAMKRLHEMAAQES